MKIRGFKIHTIYINPKILTKAQLYGHYDEAGDEFKDGVFLKFLRDSFALIEENNHL
jgi:hypothetical protein